MVPQFDQALYRHCEALLGAVAIQDGKTALHGLGPPHLALNADAAPPPLKLRRHQQPSLDPAA